MVGVLEETWLCPRRDEHPIRLGFRKKSVSLIIWLGVPKVNAELTDPQPQHNQLRNLSFTELFIVGNKYHVIKGTLPLLVGLTRI